MFVDIKSGAQMDQLVSGYQYRSFMKYYFDQINYWFVPNKIKKLTCCISCLFLDFLQITDTESYENWLKICIPLRL